MKTKKSIYLGELIVALYDEAAKVTSEKRMRTFLTYLALIDLQRRHTARRFRKA